MDKFRIQGGGPLEGEIAISGAKNSALPALAACLLTERAGEAAAHPAGARHRHHGAVAAARRRASWKSTGGSVTVRAAKLDAARSALRPGEDHARFEPGAGAAGGAHRTGARFDAGRLRHRRAAHQSARCGAGATGRRDSRRRTATWKPKRRDGLKGAQVHFDRITVTGTEDVLMAAVLAEGETVIEQRRARTGGAGSGGAAEQNGRAHRRRGHFHHSRAGREPVCTAPSTPSFPIASKPARS